MRTDSLLQATADAFNLDYNELYALKYELDHHTYYFGEHFFNPREKCMLSSEQFSLHVTKIRQISELLTNNPYWVEHTVTSPLPTIVTFNYNYANWAAALHREGYQIEPPLWLSFQTENALVGLLQTLCASLKGMLFSDFKLILSDDFRTSTKIVTQILMQYYNHPRFKALFLPFALSYPEYIGVSVFKKLGKPSFVLEHGIPGGYNFEVAHIPDFTVVWGEKVKQNYLQCGASPERIIVAGHPTYQSFAPSQLRCDVDNVLVCTYSLGGAPSVNNTFNPDRGHIQYYLYTIQSVLKKLGIQKATLRPHPSESSDWYKRFVDTNFYKVNQAPISDTLSSSSLVIGPPSTLFIEAIYFGVNYIFYCPDEFKIEFNKEFCEEEWPPYDGSDPRVPVARNPAELERIIRQRKAIDPSCFSDYIQIPFNLDPIIQRIKDADYDYSKNTSIGNGVALADSHSTAPDKTVCPVSGLIGELNCWRDPEELAAAYENYLGAPLPEPMVRKYFRSRVYEYECDKSGIRWYTNGIVAEGDFYETLAQIYPWYYRDVAWDKDLACSILQSICAQDFVEFGCGNGSFLRQAAQYGIKGYGIDMSEKAVNQCIAQGFEAYPLNATNLSNIKSEVLVLLQVIEHVLDPVGFLKSILEKIPAKTLVISAPSYEALLGYTRDPLSWPPHHFTAWSEKGFHSLAEKIGYRVESAVSEPLTIERLEGMLAMEKSRKLRKLPQFPIGQDCAQMLVRMQELGEKWAMYSHGVLCVMSRL